MQDLAIGNLTTSETGRMNDATRIRQLSAVADAWIVWHNLACEESHRTPLVRSAKPARFPEHHADGRRPSAEERSPRGPVSGERDAHNNMRCLFDISSKPGA